MSRVLNFQVPVGLAALLLLAACAGEKAIQWHSFGDDSILLTKAEYRAVTRTRVGAESDFGRIKPSAIVCAEPSPDVAKAVSESFELDSKIAADVAGQGSGSLALDLARQRAEAIAQMTERIATVQLLRDGMYRACEAYANGALSKTEYAVMLSRYDDTMVTLLLAELAAGNVGRSLAGVRSGTVDQAGEIEPAAGPGQGNDPGRAAGAGLEAARILESMQKNYLHDINMDAVEIACLSALSGGAGDAPRTALERHCQDKVVPALALVKQNLLNNLLARGAVWDKLKALDDASNWVNAYKAALGNVGQAGALATSKQKDLYVEIVQGLLKKAGYEIGSVDGLPGPVTRAKFRQFEKDHPAVPKHDQDPLAFLLGVREAAQKKLSGGD